MSKSFGKYINVGIAVGNNTKYYKRRRKTYRVKNKILPIMISGTIADKSGRILSGQDILAFANSMKNENVISIGLKISKLLFLILNYMLTASVRNLFHMADIV